jgi:hypothetical protein
MKTTELIEFLKSQPFTRDQAYNLLINDLYDCPIVTPESVSGKVPQQLIRFFMYQIQEVLLPVISDLKQIEEQVHHAGQVFKDELDARDAVQ